MCMANGHQSSSMENIPPPIQSMFTTRVVEVTQVQSGATSVFSIGHMCTGNLLSEYLVRDP